MYKGVCVCTMTKTALAFKAIALNLALQRPCESIVHMSIMVKWFLITNVMAPCACITNAIFSYNYSGNEFQVLNL